MKKWLNITGILIGVFSFFIFLVYFFDWKTTKELLTNVKILSVCTSIFIFFIALIFRSSKWTYILKIYQNVTFLEGFHTITISNMANFIFPVRFGEILKLYIINKVAGITYTSSISATLCDRLSQIMIMMIFLLFIPYAGFTFSQWSAKFIFFPFLFVLMIILLFVFGSRSLNVFESCIRKLFSSARAYKHIAENLPENRAIKFSRVTLENLNILAFSKANMFIIVLLSLIIIFLDGACFFFLIKAFGIHITWLQGSLAGCLMCLTFLLPTPPGQIGTAEIYPVIIFSYGLGLPTTVISSAAILWHILTMGVIILLGTISLICLGEGLGALFMKTHEKELIL